MQINIMNARAVALVAQDKERWQLAGDQLFIDMDLSKANLPAGSRIAIGTAIVEVTAPPHTGCHKFVGRFGVGRDEVCEFGSWQRTVPARYQRESCPGRNDSSWGQSKEDRVKNLAVIFHFPFVRQRVVTLDVWLRPKQRCEN
jgi:hypothetical protein